MRILYMFLLVLLTGLVSSAAVSMAFAAAPLPFRAGESLVFEVSWLRIPVGTATMRVEHMPDGASPDHHMPDVLRFISRDRLKAAI